MLLPTLRHPTDRRNTHANDGKCERIDSPPSSGRYNFCWELVMSMDENDVFIDLVLEIAQDESPSESVASPKAESGRQVDDPPARAGYQGLRTTAVNFSGSRYWSTTRCTSAAARPNAIPVVVKRLAVVSEGTKRHSIVRVLLKPDHEAPKQVRLDRLDTGLGDLRPPHTEDLFERDIPQSFRVIGSCVPAAIDQSPITEMSSSRCPRNTPDHSSRTSPRGVRWEAP